MTALNKQALREAAEKVTALNFDTAEIKREDGCYECPACGGEGWIDGDVDYCNIDGVALGVLFYGIGEHHGLAEAYLRAANPATVLALMDELEVISKSEWKLAGDLTEAQMNNTVLEKKLEAAEKRIDELSASHSKLRDTIAAIHNTIRMDCGYTPLAAILNAAKRAYDESAIAAGIGVKGE